MKADTGQNGRDEPEGGDAFGEPLRAAGPHLQRHSSSGNSNIAMRRQGAGNAADDLRDHVGAASRRGSSRCSGKTSVTAGLKCAPETGPKIGDQHDENRAGRQRVAEQRKRDVLQRLGHDAGADHGRDQKGRAKRFGRKAAGRSKAPSAAPASGLIAPSRRPISRACAERELVDAPKRQAGEHSDAVLEIPEGFDEGRSSRCRSLRPRPDPMPQCAVIGWPGHTGQLSPAALSQTVKTKSITGAPGAANSSHPSSACRRVG